MQDNKGKPLIFTIGTDDKFHLLTSEEGTTTGWSVTDLSSGFAGYATARNFAVSQDINGNISIALAISKANSAATDIFVASMLSNDASKTNWSNLSKLSQQVSGRD